MKLKKLPIWALALSILAGSGCVNDDYNYTKDDAYGTLSFALAADNQMSVGEITRAEGDNTLTIAEALSGTTPFDATTFLSNKGGGFSIVIKDSKDNEKYNGPLKDWNTETPLALGNYTVEATYDQQQIGFYGEEDGGEPAFESETISFTIANADAPTEVAIPVTLSNSILRVRYTDMFKNYYSNCVTEVTQTDKTVTFNYNETRGAFFDAASAAIKYTLTPSQAQDNNASAIEKTITQSLQAKTCHTLLFDVTNVGGVNTLTITIDDSTVTEIPIDDIDINDDNYIDNNGSGDNGTDE